MLVLPVCCSLQVFSASFQFRVGTMTIMSLSFRSLLLALLLFNVESFSTSVEEKEIVVIPNPHDHSEAVKICPTSLDWLLEPRKFCRAVHLIPSNDVLTSSSIVHTRPSDYETFHYAGRHLPRFVICQGFDGSRSCL
jgi:hypothetical protein